MIKVDCLRIKALKIKDVIAFVGHEEYLKSFQVYSNFLEMSQWTVSCKATFPGKIAQFHCFPHSKEKKFISYLKKKKNPDFSKGKLCLFHVMMTMEKVR